mgnify:CR=1 FL=1
MSYFYLNNIGDSNIKKDPIEILITHAIQDKSLLEDVLNEKFARKVKIKHKVRGERAKWILMAKENAMLALKQKLLMDENLFFYFHKACPLNKKKSYFLYRSVKNMERLNQVLYPNILANILLLQMTGYL